MKRILGLCLSAICCMLLCGCPYSADVPIDQPSIKIDARMLGNWGAASSSDYTYTISKGANDYTYKIERKSISSGDVTTYNAFFTKLKNTSYLNIYETGSSEATYYFYKIVVSAEKITLTPVTENIQERFTTSAELKSFFEKNQEHSFFFDKDEERYIKES